jgi:hypothetical protein
MTRRPVWTCRFLQLPMIEARVDHWSAMRGVAGKRRWSALERTAAGLVASHEQA